MGLFKRRRPKTDTDGLGQSLIALRLDDGDVAPAGSTVVVFDAGGHTRRIAAGRIVRDENDTVYCFHPGPYSADLTPFAGAPELGLRLQFVIDAADPRVTQQRFDLYLYSEVEGRLELSAFSGAIEHALQLELGQGSLELPPCTSLTEWHAFRAALNQLVYTRFGATVEDCVPVDLGEHVDFARMLAARAGAAPQTAIAATMAALQAGVGELAPLLVAAPRAAPPAQSRDAHSLRRLFLELPAVSSGLRLIALPPGQALFQSHQQLLRRLTLTGVSIGTMPSLAWAAPGQPLPPQQQVRRATNSASAARVLDEVWALLARLQQAVPAQLPELFDEADRILSNLEHYLQLRRAPFDALDDDEPGSAPASVPAPASAPSRKEPSL